MTLQRDMTPPTMAMITEPMALMMPMRQAPMEWKRPVICFVISTVYIWDMGWCRGAYTGYDGAHFDGVCMYIEIDVFWCLVEGIQCRLKMFRRIRMRSGLSGIECEYIPSGSYNYIYPVEYSVLPLHHPACPRCNRKNNANHGQVIFCHRHTGDLPCFAADRNVLYVRSTCE